MALILANQTYKEPYWCSFLLNNTVIEDQQDLNSGHAEEDNLINKSIYRSDYSGRYLMVLTIPFLAVIFEPELLILLFFGDIIPQINWLGLLRR